MVSSIGSPSMRMMPCAPRPLKPAPASASSTPSGRDMGLFLDACATGDLAEVQWFMKYYPHQWGCHRGGKTGLMYAAEEGRGAVISILLDKEYARWANVNARDDRGRTALLYAADAGREYAVKTLLDNNAAPDACDKAGFTALHCAAARGHLAALKNLLPKCAKVIDQPSITGRTPLWFAVDHGVTGIVRFLLDNNAKLGVEIEGQTLIDVARSHKDFDIAQMLQDEPARRDAAISAAIDGGISGGMKLRGTLTLKKKAAEKFPRPETAGEKPAAIAKLQKPPFP